MATMEAILKNLNSGSTEGVSMKLDGNVQDTTLTKCFYFSRWFKSNMAAMAAPLKNLFHTLKFY